MDDRWVYPRAANRGWRAELYRTNGQYFDVHVAENNIIESSRSTAVYKELNVLDNDDDGDKFWPAAPRDENGKQVFEEFFAQFQSFLYVPKSGTYQFCIDSDDGSLLSVDGEVVSPIFVLRVSIISVPGTSFAAH